MSDFGPLLGRLAERLAESARGEQERRASEAESDGRPSIDHRVFQAEDFAHLALEVYRAPGGGTPIKIGLGVVTPEGTYWPATLTVTDARALAALLLEVADIAARRGTEVPRG